jgi:hypothetical protein
LKSFADKSVKRINQESTHRPDYEGLVYLQVIMKARKATGLSPSPPEADTAIEESPGWFWARTATGLKPGEIHLPL